MKVIIIWIITIILLSSCGSSNNQEQWSCVEDWTVMYSKNKSWDLWWAQKWCSCEEIRNFEMKLFWEVDEDALKTDFWC